MATYATTLTRVRDWSNRDSSVVSDTLIDTCLTWAADRIYKTLRIPPLEFTRTYTITSNDVVTTNLDGTDTFTLPVPEDMIELIYLRRASDEVVFNFRLDNRTVYDSYADKQFNSFTRVGNDFILYGDFDPQDLENNVIEIHYYRRLPALDGRYEPVAANWINGTALADQPYLETAQGVLPMANLQIDSNNDIVDTGGSLIAVQGKEISHWLRDENERILVYGALIEVFNYLNEPESMGRYVELFTAEIDRLNREEMMRDVRGGTVQVSYNGGGLL